MGSSSSTPPCETSPQLWPAPPVHPVTARLAQEKKRRTETSLGRSMPCYQRSVVESAQLESDVAFATVTRQIRLDVSRTFATAPRSQGFFAWPEFKVETGSNDTNGSVSGGAAAEEALTRILRVCEWRTVVTGRVSTPAEATCANKSPRAENYVQGHNFMAAMCLGFSGGREEIGFWLFQHVMEDVLGLEYFSQLPAPFLGYHADLKVAEDLVRSEALLISAKLRDSLVEVLSMLAARCFLSGFVGFLSDGPLLALWEELFEGRYVKYPRLPLIIWLVGLFVSAQDELLTLVGNLPVDEVSPLVFKKIHDMATKLPEDWRPRLTGTIDECRVEELLGIAEDAWREYLCKSTARRQYEGHANAVSQSLKRTSNRLSDLRELFKGLPGASSPDFDLGNL